jgi:hypothetical protein
MRLKVLRRACYLLIPIALATADYIHRDATRRTFLFNGEDGREVVESRSLKNAETEERDILH